MQGLAHLKDVTHVCLQAACVLFIMIHDNLVSPHPYHAL